MEPESSLDSDLDRDPESESQPTKRLMHLGAESYAPQFLSNVPEIPKTVEKALTQGLFATTSLVQHQVESDAQYTEDMLSSIMKEFDTIIYKSKRHKRTIVIRFENLVQCPPTIRTANGMRRVITAAEARKRKLTLSSDICLDVIQETYDSSMVTEESLSAAGHPSAAAAVDSNLPIESYHPIHGKLLNRKIFKEMCMFEKPEMFRMPANPVQADECLADRGGYFIINGNEKVVIPQVMPRTNFPLVYLEKRNNRFLYTCEFRSRNEKKIRSTSTLYIHITRPSKRGLLPQIFIQVPFLTKCFIPLPSVFRLIGIESTLEMRQMILQRADRYPEWQAHTEERKRLEFLVNTILRDELSDLSLDDLCDYFGKKGTTEPTYEKRLRYVKHIFHNEFLPNVSLERTPQARRWKAEHLGEYVFKLLRVYMGYETHDERDDVKNRRLLLVGYMCGTQLRQLIRMSRKTTNILLHKAVESGKFFNITDVINTKRITSGFRKALATGNWGARTAKSQKGIAQMLTRMTPLTALSHCRRISTPLNREGKAPEPRQLHRSQWGLVDPVETPEGPPCGLIGTLALSAHVRLGISSDPVEQFLLEHIERLDSVPISERYAKTLITLNGKKLGFVTNPEEFRDMLRTKRQLHLIPYDTSIAWHRTTGIIAIQTDGGALCRPLMVVSKLACLMTLYQLYPFSPDLLWTEACLHGVIEYIDKEEEMTCRVAVRLQDLLEPYYTMAYTHVEIDPLVIYGVCSAIIPCLERNQSPRNMYQAAMGKQAIGMPSSNYQTRADSKMQILCSPQRDICTTDAMEYLQFRNMPSGQNVICAVGCYSGYNQEDSVILNQAAVDRGLFRSLFYQTFRDSEKYGNSASADREIFTKPEAGQTLNMQRKNYSLIGSDGMPKVGSAVGPGDIVLSKVLHSHHGGPKKPDTPIVTRDRSTWWKNNEMGMVEQVSLTSNSMREESRMASVRVVAMRTPEIGDKFSSRHGQKGVCGRIMPAQDFPTTIDGTQIDIIINPNAFPSRMTIGHLMEMALGKTGCWRGLHGNGSPFEGLTIEQVAEELAKNGTDRYGDECMIDGETGKVMEGRFYVGVIHYQRLKHQTREKWHGRARGPNQVLTRQPNEGRAADGGLRFGEMERDCLISHGAAEMTRDRLFFQSDPFPTVVCGKCGTLADRGNARQHKRYDYKISESEEHYCRNCGTGAHVREMTLPFGFKLLQQELQAFHITPQLVLQEMDDGLLPDTVSKRGTALPMREIV